MLLDTTAYRLVVCNWNVRPIIVDTTVEFERDFRELPAWELSAADADAFDERDNAFSSQNPDFLSKNGKS